MITLEQEYASDTLTFRFPDVHEEATCSVRFQRTLRIPDDGVIYPLPPGLGAFPLRHTDDFTRRLPASWAKRGGVIMPMHQAEAMWICFEASYPFALKVAAGKINAITGKPWSGPLSADPQDYVVIPEQPWLDGFCVEEGVIRQFVAMPLGAGYTAEEQITGLADHGGLQITAYPMKAKYYERAPRRVGPGPLHYNMSIDMDMGLAPGGRMHQEIYEDSHGLDAWDQDHHSRCFVSIANSLQWQAITGEAPPTVPPTASDYAEAGLPWYEYYGEDAKALKGSAQLGALASVASLGKKKGASPLPENKSANPKVISGVLAAKSDQVRKPEFDFDWD